MDNEAVFNPLAKRNLGKSIVDALLETTALHPGRTWATRCQAPKLTRNQILEAIDNYMEAFKRK